VLPTKANSMIRKHESVAEFIYRAGWPVKTEEQTSPVVLGYEAVTFGSRVGEQIGVTPLQLLLPKPNRVCKSKFSV